MADRKQISKKLRFELFKRDSFTCAYCGNTPPKVILEIDHIIPICKNGSNEEDNLITACFDCNRGKAGNKLSSIPQSLTEKNLIAQEKEYQYLQFKDFQKQVDDRLNEEVNRIENYYSEQFYDRVFTPKFRGSVKGFIKALGYFEVLGAMEKSCSRFNAYQSLNYFCGICWNKIKSS